MRVIFLDIDGVMAPIPYRKEPEEFSLIAVRSLNYLVDKTDAKIVISSLWRTLYKWDVLLEILAKNGIKSVPIGRTQEFANFMERENEIQAWLDDNPDVTNYVILDDMEGLFDKLESNLVPINEFNGLSPQDVEDACEILMADTIAV